MAAKERRAITYADDGHTMARMAMPIMIHPENWLDYIPPIYSPLTGYGEKVGQLMCLQLILNRLCVFGFWSCMQSSNVSFTLVSNCPVTKVIITFISQYSRKVFLEHLTYLPSFFYSRQTFLHDVGDDNHEHV